MTSAPSFTLVVNPRAGRNRGLAIAGRAAAVLEAAGRRARTRPTQAAGHAGELARDAARDGDVVVAVGGDGTLNEVLHGVLDVPGSRVGLVPIGTANVVARELGIPLGRPERAARILLEGQVAELTFGFANGRPFIANAGVGFDADVVHRLAALRRGRERPIGMASYVPIGLSLFRAFRSPRLRVAIDGEAVCDDASAVIVCNARNYGGVMALHPDAGMTHDRLHVCVRRTPGRIGVLRHVLHGLLRRRDADDQVCYAAGSRISIASDEPALVQIDGDDVGTTPLEIELAPARLRMLVPAPRR